jgi:hypothetical protein
MKTLFLGHFAATVAPRVLSKAETPLETQILQNESDAERLAPLLADAEIVVSHIWRAGFPPAHRSDEFPDQRIKGYREGSAGPGLTRSLQDSRMAAYGASRALPFVPAKVPCLITQRTFSRSGGNRSSCP